MTKQENKKQTKKPVKKVAKKTAAKNSDSQLSRVSNFATAIISLIFVGIFVGAIGVFYIVFHYSKDLPAYDQLAEYSPPTVTRLYAADGQMMEEYAKEKRLFVPINAIPKRLVNAFISAEDKNFYNHPGIDIVSIMRAAVKNISNIGKNKSLVGGSTITQQVVKNFLLTNEKSLDRKIKEAILAFRITQAFSKDKIMELYLNEIYLGNRSYGVAASALYYFNKSIDELSIEEAAMLAALPKAPSSLDPRRYPEKAKARRDWVIGRMMEEGYIDEVEGLLAISKPIVVADSDDPELVEDSAFFSEEVRRELEGLYGEEGVYERGLAIRTTLDPKLQAYAQKALRNGLEAYDKRHGWRGSLSKMEVTDKWAEDFEKIESPMSFGSWDMVVVLATDSEKAQIGFKDGSKGIIELDGLKWARKYIDENNIGREVGKPSDVIRKGDIVAVSQVKKATEKEVGKYVLQQVPVINGAIVAIDPHTGKVLAMVGGYDYSQSKFNRATQANRQPGSAFKPFVYLAALENGFAPNSIIVDEEVQLERGEDLPGWRPQNYEGEYYGPTTLRVGVEKSRNAMTVRLAQLLGMGKVVKIADRFDINKHADANLSVALGSAETSLLNLTNAYAMLVNGGKRVAPGLIERIQDSNGKTIYKRDNRACDDCQVADNIPAEAVTLPIVTDEREQVSDPIATFQIVSILEGVVQRGTGRRVRDLGKILAGKTGTTNDSVDTWFMGFSADLAVGVYVGFDTPKSLGRYETGAAAALPVWQEFMEGALKDVPNIPFRRPNSVKMVKIDATTGLLPAPDTPKDKIIYEAFKEGTEPTSSSVNTFVPAAGDSEELYDFGSGGVY